MRPSPEMQLCAEDCLDCCQKCAAAVEHCLRKGGDLVEASRIRLLTDCLEICRTSAAFLLRGSPFHQAVCLACEEICRACAEGCRRFGGEEMSACADSCVRCAKSCGKAAAAAAC